MNKKISILHIIETIGKGGGAETLLANTVTNLKEDNNIVVTLYPYYTEYSLDDVPVYLLNITSWWSFIKAILQLRRIIKRHRVQLIHAHLFWSVLLAKLAKPKSVKLVVSLHNILSVDLFKRAKIALGLEKILKNRQDAIIAVSKTVLLDYLEHVPFKKKVFVLYNLVPDIFFINTITNKNIRNKKLNCLAVGHFKPQKNYSYLITSFKDLEDQKVQLDLYGEGPMEKEMRQLIREYQLTNINIVGLSDKISEVINRYQVFISTSKYEGFGIALVEAMAAGLICIVSDIPVYREVGADACLFFDITKPNSLRNLLLKIIDNSLDVSYFPERARKRAFAISNKEAYFKNLTKIYEEIIL